MSVAWPVSLENLLDTSSFEYIMGDTVARSQVDVGLAKVRRTTTRPINKIKCSIRLPKASFSTFYNFFNTSLNGGVLPFSFVHPLTGVSTDFRFVGSPSIRPIGGTEFTVSMEWEEI